MSKIIETFKRVMIKEEGESLRMQCSDFKNRNSLSNKKFLLQSCIARIIQCAKINTNGLTQTEKEIYFIYLFLLLQSIVS